MPRTWSMRFLLDYYELNIYITHKIRMLKPNPNYDGIWR